MKQISIFTLLLLASVLSFCQNENEKKQYAVGNFIIKVITKKNAQPQISVMNKSEPARLLWQTNPGVALIGAAIGKDSIRMHGVPQGSFEVKDTIVEEFDFQTISEISMQNNQLFIKGKLSGKTGSINYSLIFKQASANQLQYVLMAEGSATKNINRLFLRYSSPKDEHIYGFGEQLSFFDQKGNEIPILVQEHGIGRGLPVFTQLVDHFADGGGGNPYITCAPVPQYITSKLNSLFLENKEYSVFNLKVRDRIEVKLFSDTLTGRIIYGKNPLDLIGEYTTYCGRMRKLPDWINNGAIVCVQNGMDTVQKRLAQLDSAGVPLAGLWIQDWCGGHTTNVGHQLWWNWHLDTSYYHGWDSLVNTLHKRNVQMLTYVNPFLAIDSPHNDLFLFAEKKGYIVRHQDNSPYLIRNSNFSSALIDLSNPDACTWIKSVIDSEMIKRSGASGWMADFAEALPFDAKLFNNAPTSYWHNHYTEKWAEINREAINESGRSSEMLFFNRSGFTKSPSQSTLFWLGDQMQTWDKYDGLKTALTGILSAGISGFSLIHSDIGGYNAFEKDTFGIDVKIARSKELLMRWEELNVFNAIFRTHEGINPKISVQYYTDSETMTHFARSAKIFKALSFYRKQLIQQATDSGYPIMRHPFIQFPDDANTWSLKYQFMYGAEFMVAPVVDPGRRSVELYLPKGIWINVWGSEIITQKFGGWVTANAPIGQPVMFYQKGSKIAGQFIDSLKAANVYQCSSNITSAHLMENDVITSKTNGLQVKVYPDPAHDFCFVEMDQHATLPLMLTIINISGNIQKVQVINSKIARVNMSDVIPGEYIFKLTSEHESFSLKVVKE